jgi:hypothetical protein
MAMISGALFGAADAVLAPVVAATIARIAMKERMYVRIAFLLVLASMDTRMTQEPERGDIGSDI